MTPSQQLQKLLGNLDNYNYGESLHLYSLATALQAGLLARMHAFQQQAAMPDIDHLLKVDEIAARLGTSKKWVLSRFHKLPFSVAAEGLRRFSARRFEQWIADSQASKMPQALPPTRRQYERRRQNLFARSDLVDRVLRQWTGVPGVVPFTRA